MCAVQLPSAYCKLRKQHIAVQAVLRARQLMLLWRVGAECEKQLQQCKVGNADLMARALNWGMLAISSASSSSRDLQ